MKLEQSFTVDAPIDEVWAAMIDVERIAPCLPGAEISGADASGGYEGTFTVKLGPTVASYRGALRMVSVDEAARTATMSARGTDRRGQGSASATIVSAMRAEGAATVVDVATDFTITGRLARFGRSGMVEDISRRLLREFAECLQAMIVRGSLGGGAVAGVAAPVPPDDAGGEPAAGAVAGGIPSERAGDEAGLADAAIASAGGAAAEAASAAAAPPEADDLAS